jgi:hypothetical protein
MGRDHRGTRFGFTLRLMYPVGCRSDTGRRDLSPPGSPILELALPGSKPTLGPQKKKEAQPTESEPGIADSYVLWFLM